MKNEQLKLTLHELVEGEFGDIGLKDLPEVLAKCQNDIEEISLYFLSESLGKSCTLVRQIEQDGDTFRILLNTIRPEQHNDVMHRKKGTIRENPKEPAESEITTLHACIRLKEDKALCILENSLIITKFVSVLKSLYKYYGFDRKMNSNTFMAEDFLEEVHKMTHITSLSVTVSKSILRNDFAGYRQESDLDCFKEHHKLTMAINDKKTAETKNIIKRIADKMSVIGREKEVYSILVNGEDLEKRKIRINADYLIKGFWVNVEYDEYKRTIISSLLFEEMNKVINSI